MKHITGILLILSFLLLSVTGKIFAQSVKSTDALTAATNYLNLRHPNQSIGYAEALASGNEHLAWLIHCQPNGFVIISNSKNLPPILAWSDEDNFAEGEAWTTFLPLLKKDLQLRKLYAELQNAEALKNHAKWEFWLNPPSGKLLFEQWPPEDWSPTGGWLFTNWTQTAPYNALCPIDGQSHARSVAGCPATAMAQIVNFHHRTNETRFSDDDDYYHSFGAGNSYWIDDDWESFGFPSWDQLNVYLDTLEAHYEQGITLKNTDKAALTYACGAAAKQVYSSSVSGTYGINQAYDAFIRFGYSDAQLLYPTNPDLNARLADNIKIALPAQLGLVNPTETAGHNVVVDGYNTDELYHFNFGWGGSANGWYTMPPESIPYDLTVIEGIVLDINLSNSSVGTAEQPVATDILRMNYSQETQNLHFSYPSSKGKCQLTVFNCTGGIIMQLPLNAHAESLAEVISLSQLTNGIFIARLNMDNGTTGICKFVR